MVAPVYSVYMGSIDEVIGNVGDNIDGGSETSPIVPLTFDVSRARLIWSP